VTRYQFLRPKCTKVAFVCGSASDPAGGAYSAPPGPLAVFKGSTCKGREGKGRGGKGGRRGEGKGKRKNRDSSPPMRNPGYATRQSLHKLLH